MLSCKEIVKLANSNEGLPILKRLELRMHLLMCRNCSNYFTQLKMVSAAFKTLLSKEASSPESDQKVQKLENEIIRTVKKSKS